MSVERARQLRKRVGAPEAMLWNALRELKPLGYHFRRQVGIGRYYLDFASHHPRLAIEVDGDSHAYSERYDAERDAFIRSQGYRVLRVSNLDVMSNIDGVATAVLNALAELGVPPNPVPTPRGPRRPRKSRTRQNAGADGGAVVPPRLPPPRGEGTRVGGDPGAERSGGAKR